jgi:hypothetical protein
MRFEFADGGRVFAAGFVKGAIVSGSGFVANSDSYAALGLPVCSSQLPEPVRHWLDAEQGLMQSEW